MGAAVADINDDGGVGLDDVGDILTNLNTAYPPGDLNCDGGVGLDDAGTALAVLNDPPGPSGLSCAGTGSPCSAQ